MKGMVYLRNKMNIIMKSLAYICIALTLIFMTGCDNIKGSKPMLKLTVNKGTFAYYLPAGTDYYIVYENGVVKKTKEFQFSISESKGYSFIPHDVDNNSKILYDLDTSTSEGKKIYEIAKNIAGLESKKKMKIISEQSLVILDSRYFFIAFTHNIFTQSTLFEYFPANSTAKKIVSFNDRINHVELYKSK